MLAFFFFFFPLMFLFFSFRPLLWDHILCSVLVLIEPFIIPYFYLFNGLIGVLNCLFVLDEYSMQNWYDNAV
ncbi:hypothetical protein L2E82_37640 [Cichorium intybus]|uniref:Uncharacterized protein n=1 Tax=Cichorium intybus TaxID=13427 RepID=A0ACB9AET6_CICIN|nr:hypothetical protein L2E82_37640 [Cichorium intybus]